MNDEHTPKKPLSQQPGAQKSEAQQPQIQRPGAQQPQMQQPGPRSTASTSEARPKSAPAPTAPAIDTSTRRPTGTESLAAVTDTAAARPGRDTAPNMTPNTPPNMTGATASETTPETTESTPDTFVDMSRIEPKRDALGRAYATGKRKESCARVWIKSGSGKITVNGRDVHRYFGRPTLRMLILSPLAATERENRFDISCTINGGGLSGQAGALRHGISRALAAFEPPLHPVLRKNGFLTRDSRIVERKKYGRHKARRSHQFSKR